MHVLKVLAADVERAFLTVIFNEVLMTTTDFMEEQEVFDLLKKKKTAIWRLRKEHGFPQPVLTYPTRYSRKAVTRWIEEGGINRSI
ncbi:50s ribosomal protein l7 l12 [uncultured Citrobacter sp.]|uniref:50s ribosomal protein l7 l12 n=2 Tax=Citrobacter TaxID=544 RepID=A0A212I3I1_9ENTR|nr:50s ribosomal protein l7 l12 [Citrobacter amalonaticus]SBV61260.1 50s ribosomal protein l7 l12 [uncultured Citrobacter sp.]